MKELIGCWVELPDTCYFTYEEPYDLFSATTFEAGRKILIKNIIKVEDGVYIIEFKTEDRGGTWYGLIRGSSWFDKLKVLSGRKVRRLA